MKVSAASARAVLRAAKAISIPALTQLIPLPIDLTAGLGVRLLGLGLQLFHPGLAIVKLDLGQSLVFIMGHQG
jgi:hypothetical protein